MKPVILTPLWGGGKVVFLVPLHGFAKVRSKNDIFRKDMSVRFSGHRNYWNRPTELGERSIWILSRHISIDFQWKSCSFFLFIAPRMCVQILFRKPDPVCPIYSPCIPGTVARYTRSVTSSPSHSVSSVHFWRNWNCFRSHRFRDIFNLCACNDCFTQLNRK